MREAPACDLADGEAPCLFRDTALLHTKRLLAGTSKQECIDTTIPDTLHLARRCSSVHHGAIAVGIKPAHAVERTRTSPSVQNGTRLNYLPQPGARSRSSTAQHAYLSRRRSRVRIPSDWPFLYPACFKRRLASICGARPFEDEEDEFGAPTSDLAGSLVKDGVYGVVDRDGCH